MWDLKFPDQGSNPHYLKSKCTVLTTGQPGKATLDWNLVEAEPEEVTSEL